MTMTDTELQIAGMKALREALGHADTKRFIAHTKQGGFDYTEWRQDLFEGMTLEELNREAMAYQKELYGDAPPRRQTPRRELATV